MKYVERLVVIQGVSLNKLDVLASMTFGQRVAEEETEDLTKYFVETDSWRRLLSGQVDIVYGPKGAGKSALYALLLSKREELFSRSILLTSAENPRGAPAFKSLAAEASVNEAQFVNLWKLYFLSLTCDVFEEYGFSGKRSAALRAVLEREGLIRRGRGLGGLLRTMIDYVCRVRPGGIGASVNVNPVTGLPEVEGGIVFREPSASEIERGLLSLDHLFEMAEEVLAEQGFYIWILLDRLDVSFAEYPDLEKTALRALFRAYLDLLAFKQIQFKIFLRSDIWVRITTDGFREASHITRDLTIIWDRATLLKLVVSRMVQNEVVQTYYGLKPHEVLSAAESQEAFFYRVFPQKAVSRQNSLGSFEWMLSRTQDGTQQTAPRELIHLLNSFREIQVRQLESGEDRLEGEALFERSIYRQALLVVSRVRLEQTLFAEFPQLRGFIESLRGKKVHQSIGSLSKIWHLPAEVTMTTVHHLLDAGFFEERDSKEGTEYWVPYLYQEALSLIQGHAEPVRL